ncbi:MAG: hypothetical protein J6Y60_14470 [Treponema sp.]|nr:hypothetical protein [Treponema sp.]
MKKKMFIAWGLLLLVINLGGVAESHYGAGNMVHNWQEDMHAVATYHGKNLSNESIQELLNQKIFQASYLDFKYLNAIGSLSSSQKDIMIDALYEFNLSAGEVYFVSIEYVSKGINLYMVVRINSISDDGFSYTWWDLGKWRL